MSQLAGKLVREILRVNNLVACSLVALHRNGEETAAWVKDGEKMAKELIVVAVDAIAAEEQEAMGRALRLLQQFDVLRADVQLPTPLILEMAAEIKAAAGEGMTSDGLFELMATKHPTALRKELEHAILLAQVSIMAEEDEAQT